MSEQTYDEDSFRECYAAGRDEFDRSNPSSAQVQEDWDGFIAQVRADAARAALEGLLAQYDRVIERVGRLEDHRHALRIAEYRDTHYPQGGTDGR